MVTGPNVIKPDTLDLLHRLSGDKVTANCRLVGGTSLALQYSHRLSIDLDFLTVDEVDLQKPNSI